jgi:hypothetical protein
VVLTAWLGSLVFHFVGLAAMLWLVFPYSPAAEQEQQEARVELYGEVFASEAISGSVGAPVAPRDAFASSPQAAPLDWSDVTPTTDTVQRSLAPLGATGGAPDDGETGGANGGSGLSIIGIGAGGGEGDFSDFGLSGGGGGGGGGAEFFGAGPARGVKSIVYVVDSSGSMLDTFQHVRAELRRSVGKLRRSQKFHVLFFSSGEPYEFAPQKLVSALESQKRTFFEFLETIRPGGSTHPESAMRRALALEPDLIYFLTDGEFDPGLISKLDEWNKARKVRIFTIAYFDLSGAALLERIAREHNGEFKFVTERDLP